MQGMTHHTESDTMQTPITSSFSNGISGDFTRFLLASLAVGVLVAALLSLAVVALSSAVPGVVSVAEAQA